MNKRVGKRIPIGLDASFGPSCMALTENISEKGIYIKIACTDSISVVQPGRELNMAIELPSGKLLSLTCKKIWSSKNTSNSLIEHIGFEIVNPPAEYIYFCHRLRLQKFKWQ